MRVDTLRPAAKGVNDPMSVDQRDSSSSSSKSGATPQKESVDALRCHLRRQLGMMGLSCVVNRQAFLWQRCLEVGEVQCEMR